MAHVCGAVWRTRVSARNRIAAGESSSCSIFDSTLPAFRWQPYTFIRMYPEAGNVRPHPYLQGIHKVWVHWGFHYLFYLFMLFFKKRSCAVVTSFTRPFSPSLLFLRHAKRESVLDGDYTFKPHERTHRQSACGNRRQCTPIPSSSPEFCKAHQSMH